MDFTAASADEGFRFTVTAEGQWRSRGRRLHHAPEAIAVTHVIDEFSTMAAACPIVTATALQHRANARLGRRVDLPGERVRVNWASVQVHVSPEDLHTAQERVRLRARAQADQEIRQLRVDQALVYRDQLREDPTLILAQLLVESPAAVTEQTLTLIPQIAARVSAYAPGAAWVQTAHLLDEWYGGLAQDAQQFIIDRLCTVAREFDGEHVAQRLKEAHRGTADPALPVEEPPHDEPTA
ncbi:hypothetical protein HHL19_18600 [Streptomyces sp. R302]|uniref:hypothetical protein n=1 Tax=unclassified Streptomyces TaxID=2593676 RepID=UPI00145E9C06|nr:MULTISPECIES: hypothetical protein [unclassified Streptomyces]NML54808.1 hypothetical protein [Streptomyces sp. R301]NML80623.1 hypothetical protein [Streptomyces sp. R302]